MAETMGMMIFMPTEALICAAPQILVMIEARRMIHRAGPMMQSGPTDLILRPSQSSSRVTND
jgi:hypothetical protein